MEHVWDFFADVYDPSGAGMGPGRIKPTEIEAYCRLTRQRLEPWEIKVLFRLADEYVISHAKKKPISGDAGQQMNEVALNDSAGIKALFVGRSRKGKAPPAA